MLALAIAFLKLPPRTQQPVQTPLKVAVLLPQDENIADSPLEETKSEPVEESTELLTEQVPTNESIADGSITNNPIDKTDADHSLAVVDWYATMDDITSEIPASKGHLSPLAAAKEAAQKRYAPVGKRKEIWDYVEKDPYGRTLLKAGDCYRVLDDPHLPTIDIFENFTRFLVFCRNVDRSEISMDGLDEILKRYKYLQPPP